LISYNVRKIAINIIRKKIIEDGLKDLEEETKL
jgi:hypothetical protein